MEFEEAITKPIPEDFWVEEKPMDIVTALKLLVTETDRLEEENHTLKELVIRFRDERDTYRQRVIILENTNAILVSQGRRK